ncbi:MAG: hypothetical protein JJU45_05930 [Acidimicrobiia bacterium]|nr:hypothetical protein [Acidimicrobiia bacterium]
MNATAISTPTPTAATTVVPGSGPEAQSPAVMLQRAAGLRRAADQVPAPVAVAYRRRASELELTAWALEVASGHELAIDDIAA